ncbi:hypothetical protein OIU85_003072 [Salix viminalis]|uniref:Uncharacterized protein n=1 Tax=Salix viminalis TaxID=40686 RepID=A0A9Q0PYC9_SALVM|nr:hypothetical protein OIU85_003072 [Salix viminalis]
MELKQERPPSAVGGVSSDLAACVSYLIGKAGDIPPPQCCAGRVIKLKDGAVTIADRHDVKATAAFISGIKGNAASSLPTKVQDSNGNSHLQELQLCRVSFFIHYPMC